MGQVLKLTFEIFTPLLKNLWGKISPIRRWSEAHNLETAQHIDKQKYIFHLPYAIKTYQTWGHHHTEFWCKLGKQLINYKWYAQCVFCPISQNFLLVGPYFQRIIFRPQRPLLIAVIVWGCGLSKIFGDWKYASNYGTVAYVLSTRQCAAGGSRGDPTG